ncbi:hypothetical protein C477_14363 [Haloterrigena salina JCM 13891]|uniref:Uncharacterized protein n=1 Tax=Haloterrigena salina JCM 13891 TaxID=1227488 RepID=M0C4D9_9EURY|nr:hypothetical protein C477_14363 [Haloterrigena salina JCM 13891]
MDDFLEVAFPVSKVRFLPKRVDDYFLFKSKNINYIREICNTLDKLKHQRDFARSEAVNIVNYDDDLTV